MLGERPKHGVYMLMNFALQDPRIYLRYDRLFIRRAT